MERKLKRYYRQIQSWLPCGGKFKRQTMAQIRDSVACYLAQNPNADFDQVCEHFGSPRQIAAAYVDGMDTERLLRGMKLRRTVVTVAFACAFAILAGWACIATRAVCNRINSMNGYVEIEVYGIDPK